MQIAADRLRQLAATILQAAGSSAAEAEKVAARLVGANLAGHDSHGVIRVPQYVGQVVDGTIVPNQNAEVVRETEVVTVLDGHFGYGQIVGEQAVQAAIDKAMRHGIAMSALRRSAHLGRLGDWAEMTAAAGLDFAAFRKRHRHSVARRAPRRPGRSGHDQPDRDGRPGPRRRARGPGFRHLGDRRGQGPGGAQQGRGDPARLPARRRRPADHRPQQAVHRPAR